MLPPESSVTPGSTTITVSRDWCTRSYTGWTSLSESVISWAYWLTGVCSAKRQCTCPTVVSPVAEVATCRHLRSAARHQLTVVGHSLSLVRWRLTLCQIICETPLSAQQPSDNCWKHTFSLPVSTFSALGVSYKSTLLTYLLFYFTAIFWSSNWLHVYHSNAFTDIY